MLRQLRNDDADARLSFLQASARPLRRGLDLVLRRREGGSGAASLDWLGVAFDELELLEKILRLRRHDVEGVGDEELRLLQLVEVLRHEVGQAGGVDLRTRAALVLLAPLVESNGVFVARAGADAPLVHQAPGLAALLRRAVLQEEIELLEDLLPEVLLLGGREEEREGVATHFSYRGVERVFPQALDEGAERQDVGRLPHGQILLCLKRIEVGHERLRKPAVRGDDRDLRCVALLEAGEELCFGERRGHAASLVH